MLLTNPEVSIEHAVRRTHSFVTTEATAGLTPTNLAIYRSVFIIIRHRSPVPILNSINDLMNWRLENIIKYSDYSIIIIICNYKDTQLVNLT